MANFFTDIWNMISSFAFIDYVLYFAVIVLIMLIVSLVYVMKEEKEEKSKEEQKPIDFTKNETEPLPTEEIDLQNIVNTIDENPKPLVDMTAYEEEQEQKAIISYDELLKEVNQNIINYDKEEMVDNLIPVKKISVNPALNSDFKVIESTYEEKPLLLFSYEKEEAFLKAIQQLNELLN